MPIIKHVSVMSKSRRQSTCHVYRLMSTRPFSHGSHSRARSQREGTASAYARALSGYTGWDGSLIRIFTGCTRNPDDDRRVESVMDNLSLSYEVLYSNISIRDQLPSLVNQLEVHHPPCGQTEHVHQNSRLLQYHKGYEGFLQAYVFL